MLIGRTPPTRDLDEIGGLAGRFGLDPVYVMQEASTSGQLLERTRLLAGQAAARGWHFTTRLQVQAFDGVHVRDRLRWHAKHATVRG